MKLRWRRGLFNFLFILDIDFPLRQMEYLSYDFGNKLKRLFLNYEYREEFLHLPICDDMKQLWLKVEYYFIQHISCPIFIEMQNLQNYMEIYY